MEDRHCCATCIHIAAERSQDGSHRFRCTRLGYETKPRWRFACWEERVPERPMRRTEEKDG